MQSVFYCPFCKTQYEGKIFLCESGHSLCENCCKVRKLCPKCLAKMTDKRNLDIETFINEVSSWETKDSRVPCEYNGCTYKLEPEDYNAHKNECKFRTHSCHVSNFSNLKCKWVGRYEELLAHYEKFHPNNCQLTTNVKSLDIHLDFSDFKDTQLMTYLGDKQLFYYKCKVDKKTKNVFFIFQFIGDKKEARKYTYEFEINKDLRKYKITGYCFSDVEDCDQIFEEEDCVCISFKQLKHYLDKGILNVRFRISNINYVPRDQKAAPLKKITK